MPRSNSLTFHVSLFSVTVIATLMLVMMAAGWAQKRVPATAREAAASPEWASKLARPSAQPHPNAMTLADREKGRGLPQDSVVYENGPVNGTVDAWTINFGYVVSNTFTLSSSGSATGFDFYVWAYPGDTPLTVDWSITSDEFGGTTYGSGTAQVTSTYISSNQYGYDIEKVSVTGLNVGLAPGTYWLNLQNATTGFGAPLYWDENSGAGCHSPGCPSYASESAQGTIASEAFDVLGSGGIGCFQAPDNLKILHDFTGGKGGSDPGGVTIDKAGNLYGTASTSDSDYSRGLLFKLAQKNGGGWIFNPLYSFPGGEDGKSSGVMAGPDGGLYGWAMGGIQNCGSNGGNYCGRMIRLRPSPTACFTSLCGWSEEELYRKTGDNDLVPTYSLGFDQAGNLYGICSDHAVCELMPSNGGWTVKTLYTFTGGFDGTMPQSVLVSKDGNLYGVASGGGAYGNGVVFQLTPSAGGWIETVVYSFQSGEIYWDSGPYFIWDSSGNLYSTTHYNGTNTPKIFMVSRSNGEWKYALLWQGGGYWEDNVQSMIVDTAGNLFGVRAADHGGCGDACNQSASPSESLYYWIFELTQGSWDYNNLVSFENQWFRARISGLDAHGNLYGVTWDCGASNQGTVWELLR